MHAQRSRGSSFIGVALVAIAVCVGALSGCSGAAAHPEVNPDSLNSSAPSTKLAAPPPDNGGGGVSVELAQLPIGGNATEDQQSSADTCVTVNWIVEHDAAKIPPDVRITITGATFSSDVYALADSGCSGEHPQCIGFVFDASHQICDLAIAATGLAPDSTDAAPGVSISGAVTCSEGETAGCLSFLSTVAAEQNLSIPLDEPVTNQGLGSVARGWLV